MKISICNFNILFLFLTIEINNCYCQNYVYNSGFEQHIFCPNDQYQISYATGWSAVRETPDYFNACSPSCSLNINCVGVPQNIFGFQPAFEGNAYAGIIVYRYPPQNFREYIMSQLMLRLMPGHKYYVSAYISRANWIASNGACNNFGFKFYTTYAYPAIDNFSHIHETNIITDSTNWTKISGSFIADSSYAYLAIGNFYDDQHTDTLNVEPGPGNIENFAYYYVDKICVSSDSLICNLSTGIDHIDLAQDFKISPSPFSENLNIAGNSNETTEIILYDIYSRKIFRKEFINTLSICTQNFEEGIYLYVIIGKNEIIKQGKIIKQ